MSGMICMNILKRRPKGGGTQTKLRYLQFLYPSCKNSKGRYPSVFDASHTFQEAGIGLGLEITSSDSLTLIYLFL